MHVQEFAAQIPALNPAVADLFPLKFRHQEFLWPQAFTRKARGPSDGDLTAVRTFASDVSKTRLFCELCSGVYLRRLWLRESPEILTFAIRGYQLPRAAVGEEPQQSVAPRSQAVVSKSCQSCWPRQMRETMRDPPDRAYSCHARNHAQPEGHAEVALVFGLLPLARLASA